MKRDKVKHDTQSHKQAVKDFYQEHKRLPRRGDGKIFGWQQSYRYPSQKVYDPEFAQWCKQVREEAK